MDYAISIGYRLSGEVFLTIKDTPTLVYKHHYKTINWLLDQWAEKIANMLQEENYRSLAIPASQTVDWEKQVGHFPHILAGRECGFGWIGRSGLLVNPKYGAKVRYATILTDLVLDEYIGTIVDEGCKSCSKCITACPAGALTNAGYDKVKCLEQLKKFASIHGIGVYICGICVKVCDGVVE